MRYLLLPLLALMASKPGSSSFSCAPCESFPCQIPDCCESGYLTSGVCGCCDVCARPEGAGCGGPWGDIKRKCAHGTRCLRSCTPKDTFCFRTGNLFNYAEGRCVNGLDAEELLNTFKNKGVAARLDDDFSEDQKPIASC